MRLRLAGVLAAAVLGAGCGSSWTAFVVGIDEVEPAELADALARPEPPLVVDVRPVAAYRDGHVAGAVALRLEELTGWFTRLGPPRDRPVVFVCRGGVRSVFAAAHVAPLGYLDVRSLAGGMQAWTAARLPTVRGEPPPVPAAAATVPLRPLTGFQEFMEIFAGFVIKPGYMLLSLVLIVLLWKHRSRELALIRWGVVAFLAGEIACYVNVFGYDGRSDGWELLHGFGMLVLNVLVPWGLWTFVDEHFLRFSNPQATCTAQRLCGKCWKHEPVSCVIQRMFLFLIPALGSLAVLPLTAPLRPLHVRMDLYGTDWLHQVSLLELFVELRLYTGLALGFLVVALVFTALGRRWVHRATLPFFAGFGLLTFPFLRFVLLEAYRDLPVWADFWEEATEFIALAGLAVFLWVFRRQLGLSRSGDGSAGAAAPPPAATAG